MLSLWTGATYQAAAFAIVQEYETRKQELINVERHLLRTFGFILHVDHPHKFVLNYLNILEAGAALKQEAWNLSNDRRAPANSTNRLLSRLSSPPSNLSLLSLTTKQSVGCSAQHSGIDHRSNCHMSIYYVLRFAVCGLRFVCDSRERLWRAASSSWRQGG